MLVDKGFIEPIQRSKGITGDIRTLDWQGCEVLLIDHIGDSWGTGERPKNSLNPLLIIVFPSI